MRNHLMLDLETLDTSPGAAVLSLGAVAFDKEGIKDKTLWVFNLEENISKRRVNADTLLWWLSQGDSAKAVFEKAKFGSLIKPTLDSFLTFYKKNNVQQGTCVWSNGAGFDVPILENLLLGNGYTIPWKFWDIRCYRTVKMAHKIEAGRKRTGIKHDALDDAVFQAECLKAFFEVAPEYDV